MARQIDNTPAVILPVAPRFAWARAIATYILCTMVFAYPALAGRFLVNPNSDQYIAGFAFRNFGTEMLRSSGAIPLWNPYLFGGMPFVAAMHGDIFYPTFLLRMLLGTDAGMTWSLIIHVILAACFTYGFLRAWGFSFGASLVGGLIYAFGGNLAGQVSPGHDGKMYVSAMFPLLCWLLLRGVRDGRAGAWGLLAIVVGLSVLSPHPQLLQYSLLGSGAFALLLAFGMGAESPARPVALRRLGLAFGAVVLGMLMGAIQYLPVMEYVPWSPRASGVGGWETATSYSLPMEEMINFYLPAFSGILQKYWGRNGIHLHSEYIGAAALMLVGLAVSRSSELRRRRWTFFWLGAFVVSLLWALGGWTPFYRLIYAIVPGTKFFRAPSTMLFLVAFTLAMLAAEGIERIRLREVTVRRLVILAGVAAFVSLLAISGALGNMASTMVGPERYEALGDPNATRFDGVRTLLFALATLGVALASLRGRIRTQWIAPAIALVIFVDLWSVLRHYWMFMPPSSISFASDPTVEYIKRDSIPGRVLAIRRSYDHAPHEPMLLGDGYMAHGIRIVEGYHGNELGRFTQIGGRSEGYQVTESPQFARLYNVRYILANGEINGFQKVVGPVKTAAGTTVNLYRYPVDNPPAWVATAIVKAPDEQVLPTVLDQRFDPRTVALFDTGARVTSQNITAIPPPSSITARVPRLDPGAIDVVLSAPAPAGAALVVSENYYPGWKATVDGRPVVVGRADFTLIGVPLPTGATKIELRFDSEPYRTGKMITLIAVALALAWAIGGFVVERRKAGREPKG